MTFPKKKERGKRRGRKNNTSYLHDLALISRLCVRCFCSFHAPGWRVCINRIHRWRTCAPTHSALTNHGPATSGVKKVPGKRFSIYQFDHQSPKMIPGPGEGLGNLLAGTTTPSAPQRLLLQQQQKPASVVDARDSSMEYVSRDAASQANGESSEHHQRERLSMPIKGEPCLPRAGAIRCTLAEKYISPSRIKTPLLMCMQHAPWQRSLVGAAVATVSCMLETSTTR